MDTSLLRVSGFFPPPSPRRTRGPWLQDQVSHLWRRASQERLPPGTRSAPAPLTSDPLASPHHFSFLHLNLLPLLLVFSPCFLFFFNSQIRSLAFRPFLPIFPPLSPSLRPTAILDVGTTTSMGKGPQCCHPQPVHFYTRPCLSSPLQ